MIILCKRNIVTCAAWLAMAEFVMEAQSSSSTESEDRSRLSIVAMMRSKSRCRQILSKLGASKSGSRNGNVLDCLVSSWLEMASDRTEYIRENDWLLQVRNFSHSGSLGSVSGFSRWETGISPAVLLI